MLQQGPPTNEFHREVGLWSEAGVSDPGLVDLANAWVLLLAERLQLLFEAALEVGVVFAGLRHEFVPDSGRSEAA